VILVALIGAALAALYASSQEDEYASTASLLIRPIEVDLASTNLRPDQLVNLFTEREVVRSTSVATQVSERLDWRPAPETLQRNLQLVVVDETQVLRVTYVAPSASRAQAVAQTFAEVYLEQRNAAAEAEVERRAGELEAELEAARESLAEIAGALSRSTEGSIAYVNALTQRDLVVSSVQQLQTALAQTRGLSVKGGTIISPANLPTSPENLSTWLLVAIGLVAGGLVGIPLAFARDSLDDRIRSDEDLERALGRPVLGTVPGYGSWLNDEKQHRTPVLLRAPRDPASEAFRRVRSTLLAVARDEAVSSILVTSAVEGEGAPNVAVNLAIAFAQAGTDVVLISANFRAGHVDELLGMEDAPGLGDVLLGKARAPELARLVPGVPDTLRVIPSGAALENPADALDSPVVEKVLGGFDIPYELLIVEAPPVTSAADALSLAQVTGGVVLCVRSWASYYSTVDDAVTQLGQVRANILGVLMT
jgi:capsular exopolysaccharide synthesis family protein